MKKSTLKNIIRQCISEVISEEGQPEPYDQPTDTFQPSPRDRTEPSSFYNKFHAEIASLKSTYPNISFGYIGNVWNEPGMPKDDRSWYIWVGNKKFGGYDTQDLPRMWNDWQKKKQQFLQGNTDIREMAANTTNKLSNSEKNKIGLAFKKAGLDGNGRFVKKEQGLRAVTDALSSLGFDLGMVSSDMIMGDTGSRNFIFRRANAEGQDPFTEQPEIPNSRIVFNWTLLAPDRYEILAYAS